MANPSVGATQISTRAFERIAAVGQVEDGKLSRIVDLINVDPQAKQVTTATFASAQASYSFDVRGVTYTWTPASTPASAAAAAAAFTTWWNEQAVLRAWMTASYAGSGADVVLTGNTFGMVIDFSNPSTGLSFAATTAADEADPIEFGRVVLAGAPQSPGSNNLDPDGRIFTGVKAAAAKLTEQDDVWTVADPGTGQRLMAGVDIVGVGSFSVIVDTTGTIDTDLDNLETLFNEAITDLDWDNYVQAEGPTASGNSGEFMISAGIAGVEFTSFVSCDDAAGYPVISVTSNKALATSLHRKLAGISIRATDEVPSTVGSTSSSYGANKGVRALASGRIWVVSTESIAYGDQVYVGTGSGEEGLLYKAAGNDRIPLPLSVARWLYKARSGEGDDLALVQIHADAV